MIDSISAPPITAATLREALPTDVDFASARLYSERSESLSVERGQLAPIKNNLDTGVMFTVWHNGGLGYGATADLSSEGLAQAIATAKRWAQATAGAMVAQDPPNMNNSGKYATPVRKGWAEMSLADRIDLLKTQAERLKTDDRIVQWSTALMRREVDTVLVTTGGGEIEQNFASVYPYMEVYANEGSNTQRRTFGALAYCGQGGIEVLDRFGFEEAAPQIASEAIALLSAPNCPSGVMDLVLAPDQMILQLHESIGHPLELDRILGDERNYAGTSFVTPDMFGTFQYGSELLNVTFDPTVEGQLASYGFDDEGNEATRQYLIKDGVLLRGLGAAFSQQRVGIEGVANARSVSWNRPPIDRMANINIEPGASTEAELIESVENGVLMRTNKSWSIDDSRNKFQFGCEYGELIKDGEIVGPVRNPGYRGISRNFWSNLTGVANNDSFMVMGTPNCGKGELNQSIDVGHGCPTCKFSDIEVFGGEE